MFSSLTFHGLIEWLLQFTTRRIVVVVFLSLAVSLAHSKPIDFLAKAVPTRLVNRG